MGVIRQACFFATPGGRVTAVLLRASERVWSAERIKLTPVVASPRGGCGTPMGPARCPRRKGGKHLTSSCVGPESAPSSRALPHTRPTAGPVSLRAARPVPGVRACGLLVPPPGAVTPRHNPHGPSTLSQTQGEKPHTPPGARPRVGPGPPPFPLHKGNGAAAPSPCQIVEQRCPCGP